MAKPGQNIGNKNAAKKGPKRVDVHISVADERRAKVVKFLKEQGIEEPTEEDIKHEVQVWLYQWIDGLPADE